MLNFEEWLEEAKVRDSEIEDKIINKEPFRASSASGVKNSNGDYEVYSYDTVILKITKDGKYFFNSKKYSVTTSKLQNIIKSAVKGEDLKPLEED